MRIFPQAEPLSVLRVGTTRAGKLSSALICIRSLIQFQDHKFLSSSYSKLSQILIFVLKPGSHLPKKFVLFFSMKAFKKIVSFSYCSILLSFSRYLNLVMQKKPFEQKDQVNFKFYDATTWLTKNTIHILPNILQSKGNQIMEYGQLIVYNKVNIFLQKSRRK